MIAWEVKPSTGGQESFPLKSSQFQFACVKLWNVETWIMITYTYYVGKQYHPCHLCLYLWMYGCRFYNWENSMAKIPHHMFNLEAYLALTMKLSGSKVSLLLNYSNVYLYNYFSESQQSLLPLSNPPDIWLIWLRSNRGAQRNIRWLVVQRNMSV